VLVEGGPDDDLRPGVRRGRCIHDHRHLLQRQLGKQGVYALLHRVQAGQWLRSERGERLPLIALFAGRHHRAEEAPNMKTT
jgi:hypothetical protein